MVGPKQVYRSGDALEFHPPDVVERESAAPARVGCDLADEHFTGLMRAFGLIKGDVDLFDAFNDFSSGGTLAYYSTEDKTITVRGQRLTPAVRATLEGLGYMMLWGMDIFSSAIMKKLLRYQKKVFIRILH